MAQKHQSPFKQISCHAWSPRMDMIAISPNNNQILIYEAKAGDDATKWTLKWTLKEHSEYVSSLDWSAQNGMLVSASHDRNAYVWSLDKKTNEWKPTIVILRIVRGATSVKWSPAGNKFAVGCGAKCVPVCHYEESSNWWISKMIKKHKSTILTLDWCPNNKFVITGSSDKKCRVFSAWIKGVDSPQDDGFGDVWRQQHEFGEVLCEFDHAEAWVNAVAWSPAGFRLAFAGHGSTVHFVQLLAGGAPVVQSLPVNGLPYLDMCFTDNNTLVCAGYDMNPAVFKAGGADGAPQWDFKAFLDSASAAVEKKESVNKMNAARAVFANKISKGTHNSASGASLKTKHQNTITNIVVLPDGKQLSTSGLDGRVIFWKRP